jgi:hypothetical protein
MENKRLFIGNLDFSATAGEVQSLLSRFGTVVSVTLKQKKGYAFVEMETSEAAAQAVQQLEGTHHRGRIMRLSLEMKARKARTVSAKRYKERGAALGSRKLHGEESAKRPWSADRPAHASRPDRGSSRPGPNRPVKPESGYTPRERTNAPVSGRSSSSSRGTSGPARTAKRPWAADRPAHASRLDRGSSRPGPSRPVKAESGYTPRERTNAPVSGRSSSSPRGTSGPARPHQKARFPKRPAHSMSASGDRLTERPQSSTTVTPKPRTYAHARSSNATGHQPGNRARPGAGARKGVPASSGPKHRGTAAGFNKPRRRD